MKANETYNEFPDFLRNFLDTKGMTQVEYARITGIDQTFVTRLLSGERLPSEAVLERTANAFGVDLNLLIRLSGRYASLSKPRWELIQLELLLAQMTEAQREQLLDYATDLVLEMDKE